VFAGAAQQKYQVMHDNAVKCRGDFADAAPAPLI
jgi:hypothetical protein